jgi:4'-phosphopantetheinyl transferase
MSSGPIVLLVAASRLPAGTAWLRPAERAALRRFRAPRRRRDFRLGRFAAKTLLAAELQTGDPTRFEVRPMASGAPLALGDGAPLELALSISHGDGWAAAAIRRGAQPLGCDLERVEARSPAFLGDYLTRGERAFVAAGPAEQRAWRTNLVWSAKEAVMKALGEGLRLPPMAVEVSPLPDPASEAGWGRFSILAPSAASGLRGFWRRHDRLVLTLAGGPEEPRWLPPMSAPATGLRPGRFGPERRL